MQETEDRVLSLGFEDLLEKKMVTHSNSLVWRIPWTEEPGELLTTRSQKSWIGLSVSKQHRSTYHTCSVSLFKMLICSGQTPLLHLKFPLWLPPALSEKHQVLPGSTRLCLCLSLPLPPQLRCSGWLSISTFMGFYCVLFCFVLFCFTGVITLGLRMSSLSFFFAMWHVGS